MAKLWEGRTDGKTDLIAEKLNASIFVDKRMYQEDIEGSVAHAKMLMQQGIISEEDGILMVEGLLHILSDIQEGKLEISEEAEDIHTFVEQELTKRIGDAGKRLHTARSRNDQVALDIRLNLRKETREIQKLLKNVVEVLKELSEKYIDVILPGYTHLQRAQPILLSQYFMAYASMFLRDLDRLEDCKKRMSVSPIGSCALAGTTYDTDRRYEAKLLDMDEIVMNSMDGVSDRDFALEFLSDCSILMMHLSRMCEEMIIWSSWEFHFISFSDAYTTGSSIMPQKKNSDMAELIRGKTGRVYGDLVSLLTVMKGLPLAYNKDMQEDKEPIFDTVDTVKICLQVFAPMLLNMKVEKESMLMAAKKGFINATDLADYLTKKGMPFRSAYKISGQLVHACIEKDIVLEDVSLEEYRTYSDLFEEDIYEAIDLKTCVDKRTSEGGTSQKSVEKQIQLVKEKLGLD